MLYQKPEVLALGDAGQLIQGFRDQHGEVTTNPTSGGSYDVDE